MDVPRKNSMPEQHARVIFLDCDGCVHPTARKGQSSEGVAFEIAHFGWVPVLEAALHGHDDVAVVVHSTWRYMYSVEELRGLLGPLGPRVLGLTPRGPRYESILWWLHLSPSFTDYRIIDDDATEFPKPAPMELILCDPSTGVTAPGVLKAIADWLDSPVQETEEDSDER